MTLSHTDVALTDPDILAHFEAVRRAQAKYREEQSILEEQLRAWIQARVSPGQIVDLSHENRKNGCVPVYLSRERVMRGNARNATSYRIESIQKVQVNATHPCLSTWTCYAIPISRLTGKPMSGRVARSRSHGASSNRDLITLQFQFGREGDAHDYESPESPVPHTDPVNAEQSS